MLKNSPLELMQMHVAALYVHDERMRMVAINQWDGGGAPRFFLGRTPEGSVWRFRSDLPDELTNELERLCRNEPDGLTREPHFKESYIQLLASCAPIDQLWEGPAYGCSKSVKPFLPSIRITDKNAHLLQNGFEAWLPDVPHRQPFIASIEDGHAVALCSSVRITDLAHEAGVETLPTHRCRGHAASVVAAWANTLLKENILPLYSTSWENTASQKVAKKLGLLQYGTDFHIT